MSSEDIDTLSVNSSHWNFRVLAHQFEDEIQLEIHEVYYDNKDIAHSYTANGVGASGESKKELKWVLDKMIECLEKPILWADDKFPEEYRAEGK